MASQLYAPHFSERFKLLSEVSQRIISILELDELERSALTEAGNILASLDNYLAETVEGARSPFNPHSPTPGKPVDHELVGNHEGMPAWFIVFYGKTVGSQELVHHW